MRRHLDSLVTLIREAPPRSRRWLYRVNCIGAALLLVLEGALLFTVLAGGSPLSETQWISLLVTVELAAAMLMVFVSVPAMVFSSLLVWVSALVTGNFGLAGLIVPYLSAVAVLYLRDRGVFVYLGAHALVQVIFLVLNPESWDFTVFAVIALLIGICVGLAFRRQHGILQRSKDERDEERARHDKAIASIRRSVARDLHDVLAQDLAVIAMQSESLRHVKDSGQQLAMATTVSGLARQAHAELRGMLDVLYLSSGDGGQPAAEPTPAESDMSPTITITGGIDGVSQTLENLGRPTTTSISVDPDARVPGSVHVSLYRILQEATANIIKHSPDGANCEVWLEVTPRTATLTVVNDVSDGPPARPGADSKRGATTGRHGYGLLNIRERSALAGGSAATGVQDGRWRIRTEIPLSLPRDLPDVPRPPRRAHWPVPTDVPRVLRPATEGSGVATVHHDAGRQG